MKHKDSAGRECRYLKNSYAVCAVLQGIVGGTYDRYLEGEAAVSKPEDQLYIPDDVRGSSVHLTFWIL